jgi:hypothetical protein
MSKYDKGLLNGCDGFKPQRLAVIHPAGEQTFSEILTKHKIRYLRLETG